ncbi:MAG: hypothetical protein ACO1NX_08870 [Chitinophagaceae bacterium]
MKPTLMAIMAICVLAVSCQKERSFVNKGPEPQNIWARMEARQPAPQQFTISATLPSQVWGQKGTRLKVPANAFVTASGTPVTGNVNLELKEIYEVWEMIVNNKFTQSGSTPIESGGQLFLRATQGGNELKLAPGVTLQAAMPTTDTLPGMQVFTGATIDTAGQSIFSWQLAANPATNNITFNSDSLATQQYLMQFGMLGWINCDRFLNEPLHEARVKVANALPGESVNLIVHFDGMRSVLQLWPQNGVYIGAVPQRNVTYIAIALRGDKTYAAFHSTIARPGEEATLTLAEMSDEAFGQKLKTLN